ncbi:MAG: tetratricopeptide repeat protein [Xanthobacteraceae bacterium]
MISSADDTFRRAVSAMQAGQNDVAERLFRSVLRQNPDHVGASNVFSMLLARLSRYDEAERHIRHAIKLNAKSDASFYNYGLILKALNRPREALEQLSRAAQINPSVPETWNNRGTILNDLGRHREAIADYDRAIAANANYADAFFNKGNALAALKSFAEALAAYDRALTIKASLEGAWLGRGNALSALQRFGEALEAYDRAIALKPDLAKAWHARASVLIKIDRREDALADAERALEIEPGFAEAWHVRGYALFEMNRLAEALAAFDKALAIKPDLADAISDRIFALDFADDAGFEEHQRARSYWWQKVGSAVARRPLTHHRNARDADRKIRIAYISADFRNHSAARSFRPLMLNHDKNQFEITCYTSSHFRDDVTADFQRAADRWREVVDLSDEEVTALVQDDQIDILVEMSGHSAGHRLGVFARKPAPVQVTLGSTGTGLPTIDYAFADAVICPPAIRHLYAEKVFDIASLMTIEPLPSELQPSSLPALANGFATFGVFNRVSKISDENVELWAHILTAVPRSKLLIKHVALDEASVRMRQLERFARYGIPPQRIELIGKTSREEHLAAFNKVDISLDPFPHNGGISTLESLQMGVPVVAKLGNSAPSRLGGALLLGLGLNDWVAESNEDYAAIAVKFATQLGPLEALRRQLPAKLLASPLGDAVLYARAIEAAYRSIWREYCGRSAEVDSIAG